MVQLNLQKYYENILVTTDDIKAAFYRSLKEVILRAITLHFFNFSCNLMPSALSFSCNFRCECQRKEMYKER